MTELTLKQQIRDIDHAINLLHPQVLELDSKRSKHLMQRNLLVPRLILEDKMLKDTRWKVILREGGNLASLECADWDENATVLDEIACLLRVGMNPIPLENRTWIKLEQSNLFIYPYSIKEFMPFVEKHGLVIDKRDARRKLKEEQELVSLLEAIVGDKS